MELFFCRSHAVENAPHQKRRLENEDRVMFPLSSMFKAFVRVGALKVIDADGKPYRFEGKPGPSVTLRFHDPLLKYILFLR